MKQIPERFATRRPVRELKGADDGELFLEYRQSEMLVFDNGHLKQATYDTAQGFGHQAMRPCHCLPLRANYALST